jgi:outer membrane autotransporter protein
LRQLSHPCAGTLTVGVDRLFDDRLAIGVQASINDSESEARSRTIEIEGNGVTFGPYLSYGLSQQWSVLLALDLGVLDRDVTLLNVSGEQDVNQYSGSLEFQGQYGFESVMLRPFGLLSYTRSEGDAFALKGDVLGQPVDIRLPATQADGSLVEIGLEASWLHQLSNGKRLLPYVEATARYSQVNSDSDLQLGGNPESTVDDWSGTLGGGARLLAGGTTMLQLGAAYQSLGQSELYVWEVFFFVSHGF